MDILPSITCLILIGFVIGLIGDVASPSMLLYLTSCVSLLSVTWGSSNQTDVFQKMTSHCTHPVIILLACLSIISSQFQNSHLAPAIEKTLLKIESKAVFSLWIIIITSLLSSFINNALVVSTLIPIVQKVCAYRKWNTKTILLSLSFSSMLGGTITLIGSSTNLIASSLLTPELTLDIFSLVRVSVPTCVFGLLYLTFVIRRDPSIGSCCLPYLQSAHSTFTISTKFYKITATSKYTGKTIRETCLQELNGMQL